uniref:Uncharacterized protein n=1 Tax=Cajanus cajan TaxID=3821 RepID=A0A151R792_CAJCA|nr:hypothetical protein KK1_040341 [Cajanus cajan]
MSAITFTDKDFQGIDPVQDDPMVISVEIHNCIVKKTLIDQGSSADILYWNTFKQLGIPEEELTPYNKLLVGFAGNNYTTSIHLAKGAWAEELSEVLWAYRCTPQSTTRETPFRLTYGTDAMIPVEVGEPSFRRTHFDEESNEASLRAKIDLVEEIRPRAQVIAEACKQRMTRRFSSNLTKRSFKEGHLVWRIQGSARRNPREGKLAANWDGPFRVRQSRQWRV